jgi:ADP-heptose:LPS heptosyltransferase
LLETLVVPTRHHRLAKELVKSFFSLMIRAFAQQKTKDAEFGGKEILVIRTDNLGDLLLGMPILKHLRNSFMGYRIILLARKEWLSIVQTCPYVDEFIPWDQKRYTRNVFYRMGFARALRNHCVESAIYPAFSRDPLGDELISCCRSSQKIAFAGDLDNISLKRKATNDRYYTRLIQDPNFNVSEIDRNREFTQQITGKTIDPVDFQPEIWLTQSDRIAARKLLEESGLDPSRHLIIALFPGASWEGRLWPAGRYAELADRIADSYGAKIVICGASSDLQVSSEVQLRMHRQSINLAGKTRLRDLAALFERCALFIGNETGPLHVAVTVGTSSLCIVGGGHFGRFYPYGDGNRHRMAFKRMDCYCCNWRCIHESIRCIQEIAVEDVWLQVQRMVEEVVLPERKRGTAA